MSEVTPRRIWITGASSGIGESLARELAGRGHRVVVSARSRGPLDRLAEAFPGRVLALPVDVADREAMQEAGVWMQRELGALDTAVLNAGTCEYVDMPHFDAERIRRVMETNYFGTVHGVEAALPLLRGGTRPHLVGMSSSVAYVGLPRAEAYGSSKAAIRHLFQCLRADLASERIDVSIIYPGFVKTPLTDRNDFAMPMRVSSETAARCIADALQRRRLEIRFPALFVWGMMALSALPAFLQRRLLARLSPNRAIRSNHE